MNQEQNVLILGAGVSGLSAAMVLAEQNIPVSLLERADHNGGLAVTKKRDGYKYDLGPHNIHTHFSQVETYLKRNFPNLFIHFPELKIFKRGRAISYPIAGAKVLTSLPLYKIPLAAASFFFSRVRMFFDLKRSDDNFRDWIVNRFGSVIYREYFHDYPKKVWRLEPHQIDKHVAEKRIPITSFTDLVKGVLRIPNKIQHQELTEHNYYLKQGIGEIPEFLETKARTAGAKFLNRSTPRRIQITGRRVTGVEYADAQGHSVTAPCTHLLSTIPLPDLIELIDSVSAPVKAAAKSLRYCSSVLLFLKVKGTAPLPSSILYFSEPDVYFSRVSDVGAFSKAMVPEDKALLCFEFPCRKEEPIWNAPAAELRDHTMKVLIAKGLLKASDLEGEFIEKVDHSYPCFESGYRQHLEVVMDYLKSIENLVSFGRQGGFAYVNTDAVLRFGFVAATAVTKPQSSGLTCQEWFTSSLGAR